LLTESLNAEQFLLIPLAIFGLFLATYSFGIPVTAVLIYEAKQYSVELKLGLSRTGLSQSPLVKVSKLVSTQGLRKI